MKNNSGMGIIKMIIAIIVITILVAGGVYFFRVKLNQEHNKTIQTNMLKVQWLAKDYKDSKIIAKQNVEYIGTKVSDMKNDSIVSEFINKAILKSDEYEKYYVLTDNDLSKFNTEITNEKDAYYIVNYETGEVIFTKGCIVSQNKILYKLTDMQEEK